ncbi:conjugal transfer mating pair stabilization protein TraN [Methylicorpusculum oleiharenae]|uniref:conjugal transfer mating pair stabilization protein TraN n=1 Tax=Methylicorpusculum oleiharenae TaxID=1338687 RepID=UPI0013590102|nr:conjugal transfer mating pair stabilization protein TraN [Methylicorpusculum oleiharenae]MCD2450520.1 conjugal transfer mating pair stabilization protein TraN [Methylicorpusculum oleiharenae]
MKQSLNHQPPISKSLSAVLCITMAWTPYGVSWADAIQAAGRDGQQLGQQVLGGFAFPLDTGNGTLSLNPGTAQESAISIGTLFPDTHSATTTAQDFADLYGNNPGTIAAGLNAQTALNSETSFTGEAYRTLIDNAHQSHPDLHVDPIWQNGDQVFSNFTPWAQSFSDCTTTTTQIETQQSVRVPDYQLCLRQPTVPQSCTATHEVRVEPLLTFVSGTGGLSSCGPGCLDVYIGRVGNNYWSAGCGLFIWQVTYNVLHPEAITSARLEHVVYDDQTRLFFDGNLIYTGASGWGACELSKSWVEYPNRDVTYAFNSSGHKVFQQNTIVGGMGEGYARIRLRYDVSKLITQDQWRWDGPNCQNLANAISDGICQAGSQLTCSNDPANASGCYVDPTSQVMVCGSNLTPAPVVGSSGIRNTCMRLQATGHCELNHYGQCWTDTAGTHCLQPPANGMPSKTCESLETQGCSFIKSQCTSVLDSGTCWDSVDTYDCGQTVGIPGIQSNTQQQCVGPIRCMGEDCIAVNRTQSQDFSKAVALLNSAQQMAMDLQCDYANADLRQKDPSTCQVFKGKPASCKMVGGALSLVDCCETPSGAMGLGRYIDLLLATSQMDNAVMAMDSTSVVRGAWETMRTPFTLAGDAWNSFQADFASIVNDLVGTDMLSTSDIASKGLLDSLKGELMKSVAEWIGQTFGQTAGNALFSAGGQAAFDAAGNLTPAAQSGGVQLGGGAAMAGQLLSTLMAAYTAVMIIIMIIQMIYSCEEPEYELAAKKQLKVCKDLGTFCESKVLGVCMVRKESYCCYNSPLARILNEQIKPQLGMDFGTPEKPICSGVKVADLDRIDWTQVNLDEWLAILAQTGHLPTADNAAAMLNLDQLTGSGSRLNPQKYGTAATTRQDTLTRTQGRMTDLDVPTVKRQSELEGWGMGP